MDRQCGVCSLPVESSSSHSALDCLYATQGERDRYKAALEEIANADRRKLVETFVAFGAACAVAPLVNAAQAALNPKSETKP